jgi:Neocarzinostatin family
MSRFTKLIAAASLVASSLAFVGTLGASASGTPTITLSPSTGLSTTALTDPVTVTGTGFVAGSTLYILECDGVLPTAESHCDIGAALGTAFTVPSSGNFTQNFFMVPNDTSAGAGCATSASTMTCEVVVSDNPQTADDSAEAPVTFSADASTTTTAPVTTTTMAPTTTTTAVMVTTTTAKKTVAPAKKTTITCEKGKTKKTVTAVKPVCPAGYKKI